MSHRFLLLALLAAAAPADAAERLAVWVTIQPQRYVVSRLAGDLVSTSVLVAPGQSPDTYEPTPRQIAGLADADLLVAIGVPFEHALIGRLKSAAPDLAVVDGRRGVALATFSGQPVAAAELADLDHRHEASSADPHFWVDPALLAAHAATVAVSLVERLPGEKGAIERQLTALQAELAATDAAVAAILRPYAGRSFLVYHPAFGYFARRYGLSEVTIESEGKEPSARELAAITDLARRDGLRTVFALPQFSARSVGAVAASIGAEVVTLDPLAEDYGANLERMARAIAASFP
jgi:zinc transport system substrate-binding protein